MNALEALEAARAASVEVVADGADLALRAPGPPPAAVLDALSQNKANILALLTPHLGQCGELVVPFGTDSRFRWWEASSDADMHARFKAAREAAGIDAADEAATKAPAPASAKVMTLLAPSTREDWSAADWRALYDERTGIREYDGGMGRAEAEAQAFLDVCVEWVTAHPDVDALSSQAESVVIAALAKLGIADPRSSEPVAKAA